MKIVLFFSFLIISNLSEKKVKSFFLLSNFIYYFSFFLSISISGIISLWFDFSWGFFCGVFVKRIFLDWIVKFFESWFVGCNTLVIFYLKSPLNRPSTVLKPHKILLKFNLSEKLSLEVKFILSLKKPDNSLQGKWKTFPRPFHHFTRH